MTLINQEKTIEENTSQQQIYETEVPTLIIRSSSPPPTTHSNNISNIVSSSQKQQFTLNFQLNQNYYSNSFDSSPPVLSTIEEEEEEELLEYKSFKSASNQYFQNCTTSPLEEEMMNASNNIPQHFQQQDPYTKPSQVEFVIQEPSVPYNRENLVMSNNNHETYDPSLNYVNAHDFQQVEYVNPNHYGQSMINIPQQQIIYDLPRETPDTTVIHAPADVDIESHHIKVDQEIPRKNILNWMKENRLLTIFLIIAFILFFYSAAMVLVNSVIHLIPCILATVLPIVLVKRRLILCGFVLGALFIDMIISSVLVYHLMEEDGEWDEIKVALIVVLYLQEVVTQIVGCIIVYRIYHQERKFNNSTEDQHSTENQ